LFLTPLVLIDGNGCICWRVFLKARETDELTPSRTGRYILAEQVRSRHRLRSVTDGDSLGEKEVTEFKTKREWAKFVKKIADNWYPKAQKIKLVMDNFKTHDASAFYETFEPAEAKRLWDRFEFVYTPKHGSWLNMAEIELHVLNGQCLNRHISTMKKIKEEVEAWQTNRNNKNSKINWQFTNKEARVKLKKLYPSIYA